MILQAGEVLDASKGEVSENCELLRLHKHLSHGAIRPIVADYSMSWKGSKDWVGLVKWPARARENKNL
jgi:hypothetical protein